MKIDELMLLVKAGFTKDDIMALGKPEPQEAPEDPVVQEAAQEEPKAQPQQEQPVIDDDRIAKLETKLDYVVNRFNYMQVQNSQQPAEQTESVDDILGKMLR